MPSTKRDDRREVFRWRLRPASENVGPAEAVSREVERIFTLGEANAAVAELRPVVERMVEHGRKLAEAQRSQVELVTRIAGNGGDMQPSDQLDPPDTTQREAKGIVA